MPKCYNEITMEECTQNGGYRMKKHLLRMLSAILCLSLLPTSMPAWSESESPAALMLTEEIPALTEIEAGNPPQAEATPEAAAPTIAPDSEEMLVEAILEPALSEGEASIEPTIDPSIESSIEPTIDPEAAPVSEAERLAAAIDDLTARLQEKGYASQYEQALWIYRMTIENVAPAEGDSAYAAIVDQRADSFGYARAIEALMTAAGMECMLVSANGAAWNIAKLDGEWTHIDAYADDASGNLGAHFGLTDAAMRLERSWEAASLPACDGIKNNYHLRENGCKAVSNAEELRALLSEAVQAQESELQFYNAAGIADLSECVQGILAELAPNLAALVRTDGCMASISLSAPIEDVAAIHEPILPEAILPEKKSISIGLGEQLSVAGWTLTPEGAQDTVSYSSKSKKIATVDENGVVTGKKTGKTTLTLKTSGGLQCSISVSVKKKPSKIVITADRKTLGVGEELQLGYKLSSGSAGKVVFESLNPEIASINEYGMLSAIAVGTATIRAATFNGKSDALEIQVLRAPDQILISQQSLQLGEGTTAALSAALPEGCAGRMEWLSSDESIATVSSSGKISALSTGEAEIIAQTYNGIASACKLTVVPAPSKLILSTERKTIGIGEQIQLETGFEPENAAATLKYKSSKSSVASVNQNGLITAKKAGSATITVSAHNKVSAKIKITVKKKPSKIVITADRNSLGVGEELQLGYKLSSGSAGKVVFESLNPEIASINEYGMLSAIAVGTATIRAATFNGKSDALEIQVLRAPDQILISQQSLQLGEGTTAALSAALPEGCAGRMEWLSSDESIATVSSSGKISALSAGEAEIIAQAYNGVSSACKLTVLPAPDKLILSAERNIIGIGEQIQLETGFEPANAAATLSYKSSKSSVASVDQDGLITAKKAGSATITVSAHNKISAKFTIKVQKAPSSIAITAERSSLGVGEEMQLGYKLSSGSAGRVAFDSLDPEIAHVSPDGVVYALAVGKATLYAATFNGRDDTFEIEILPAPECILLSQHSFHLGEGMTATLSANVNEGSAGQIRFASEDESIAKIDPITGKITAVGEGETRVYAQTYVQGLIEYAQIRVSPAPESLSLPYSTLYLGKGDTLQLEPIIDEGCMTAFSYSSSDSKYASVDADGLITAKAVGETTITIKTHNGLICKLRIKVRKAPTWVKMNPESLTLGLGETAQLSAEINSGYATRFTFENLSPDVLDLDENQLLTGKSLGEGVVQVYTHNGLSALCHVQVLPAPKSISISGPELMGVGMEDSLYIEQSPANSASRITYSLLSGEAIALSADGHVEALAPGSAIVRASTYLEDVYAEHEIVVLPAPDSVALSASEYTVNIDETLQLNPIIPEGTLTQFSFSAAKNGFFTIDENGLITPIRRGRTTVTVETHNGCTFTATIIVQDPYYPEDIDLAETPPNYLAVNESYTPKVVTLPETAMAAIEWTSSNPDVVKVDASTGKATAISSGRATITGVSQRNPSLSISYSIIVPSDEVCMIMPNTRTYTGSISTTLNQMKAVRSSAYSELEKLYLSDVISKSDYTSRYSYITRAFDMQLMPWMTKTKELYWKAANSEDGLKDFKTNMVYYGLPYTQANRRYNKSKAVNAGYFTDNGSYYLLQGSKFSSREYPGNDCSSFVSMAIWGTDHSNSYLTTRDILTSSSYRTLSDWTDLRPGDLLDKNGHVVMFLYYTNKAKDQFMIIEQGGSTSKERGVDNAAYSNTIACSIKDASYYTSRGYKIRRVKSLGY